VVVCEGYTDVIGLARAGIRSGVATCGTALSDEHVRVLKNFARRVVLAYDADAAGQAAAERFYEWERRYELDLAVADLPAGTDPGELSSRDPSALEAAVKGAKPFLTFRLDRLFLRSDLRTPGGKARAAEAAMEAIREHPSDLVRDQYVMVVAERTKIEPARLRMLLEGRRPPRAAPRQSRPEGPEVEALRLAVHRPEEVAALLHEVLFVDPVVLAGYRALCSSTTLAQAIDTAAAQAAASDRAEPDAGPLLQRLAVEDADAAADDVLARLAEEAAKRVIAELEAEARRTGTLTEEVGWLKLTIAELREPVTGADATGRLVRWMVDRFEVGA
jgi:DNA primase